MYHGDVNQFIGHCLIPLDPWVYPFIQINYKLLDLVEMKVFNY